MADPRPGGRSAGRGEMGGGVLNGVPYEGGEADGGSTLKAEVSRGITPVRDSVGSSCSTASTNGASGAAPSSRGTAIGG